MLTMTERNWQILGKFILYHIHGDTEIIHSRIFQEFSISMVVFYNYDEENEFEDDDEADKKVQFTFKSVETKKIIFKISFDILEDFNDIVLGLRDTLDNYMRCLDCDDYVVDHHTYNICEDCFVLQIEPEDDCAICLSNESEIWIKTPCNHHFHRKCYNKLKTTGVSFPTVKCPLCRNVHCMNELQIL